MSTYVPIILFALVVMFALGLLTGKRESQGKILLLTYQRNSMLITYHHQQNRMTQLLDITNQALSEGTDLGDNLQSEQLRNIIDKVEMEREIEKDEYKKAAISTPSVTELSELLDNFSKRSG